jgi:DNA-binding winged helix-turn-helix (wHTH) protein
MDEDVFDRSIDSRILRLRRRLEADPNELRMIQTAHGVGYVFGVPVERLSAPDATRSTFGPRQVTA